MAYLVPTLILALALMSALWLLSLALRDVSIVDIAWGPAFAALSWTIFAVQGGAAMRGLAALALVTLWGVRLGGHILARQMAAGEEDHRYTAIRRKFGAAFPLLSLGIVFWVQALLLWVISWPLQAAVSAGGAANPVDVLAWTVTMSGIVIEAVADRQLAAFRARPEGKDQVLDTGLWRFSRHPNYFGDFLIWWGFFLAGMAAGAPWWTIASPIVMSALLLHFSGGDLMEETITDRRPAYRAYIRRTSAFIPWPPKKG